MSLGISQFSLRPRQQRIIYHNNGGPDYGSEASPAAPVFFRASDGAADFADPDHDGHNNWQEWRAWTNPTNSGSALHLLSPIISTNGILIRWQSVSGQSYFLERNTGLLPSASFTPLASNIVGQTGTTVFTDTNVVGTGPLFYRVGVNE